jgi:hypothetical protein
VHVELRSVIFYAAPTGTALAHGVRGGSTVTALDDVDVIMSYDSWTATESRFLLSLDDPELRSLYETARKGDLGAERQLGRIAGAYLLGKQVRPITPREQTANRAIQILHWLKRHTH